MLRTPPRFISLLETVSGLKDFTLVFRGDEVLMQGESLASHPSKEMSQVTVGSLDGVLYTAISVDHAFIPPEGTHFTKMRALLGILDEDELGLVGRAYQLAEWRRSHQYCGVCGAKTALASGDRSFKCTGCSMSFYPRISPAMMVLITRGDEILLCRHARYTTNRYTALAGFVEPGESVEECIHREVMEEVGLSVGNLKYFGSQSWPFPNSLMIAFSAEYEGGELSLDLSEISDARWFGPRDVLPEIPPTYSIAGNLIRSFRELTRPVSSRES